MVLLLSVAAHGIICAWAGAQAVMVHVALVSYTPDRERTIAAAARVSTSAVGASEFVETLTPEAAYRLYLEALYSGIAAAGARYVPASSAATTPVMTTKARERVMIGSLRPRLKVQWGIVGLTEEGEAEVEVVAPRLEAELGAERHRPGYWDAAKSCGVFTHRRRGRGEGRPNN